MDKAGTEDFDLDEASKKAAEQLQQRAQQAEQGGDAGTGEGTEIVLPTNEYCFDNIHDDDEGHAFLEAYYKANGIKGAVPTKHETIVAKLTAIWQEQQLNKKGDDGTAEQQ